MSDAAGGLSSPEVAQPAFAQPPISRSSFENRITKLRDRMKKQSLACVLVSSVLNHAVRYLGFYDPELQGRGSGAPQLVSILLPLEGDPVLFLQTFTAADYMLPRARAATYIRDIRLVGGDNQRVLEMIVDQIRSWHLDRATLGLAGGEIDWAERIYLSQELPGLRVVDTNALLNQLRIVKDAEELELMRRSAAIGDAAMTEVENHIAPGISDYEIYSVGIAAMYRLGAEEDTFVLMGIGPNDNTMLMEPLNGRTLHKGDTLVYETLPFFHLYNTELAVTFSAGPPGDLQRRAAKACEDAYEAGAEKVKPGATSAQVVETSLKVFREHGFESFTHTPGHFMGLDNYEGPSLRSPEVVLEPGMVFSFHPNVVIPFRVKEEICGILLVTDKGVENLSKYPRRGLHVV